MATKIGSLFATLRLDGSGFKRELTRSRRELKDFARSAKRAGAAITGFLGVGSAATLGLLTKRTIAYGDSVAKTADRIGLSTTALQEWRHVADLSGVSAGTLDIAVQRFGRRLGEAADGTGTLAGALDRMNVSIRNQDGSLRDVDSVFTEYLGKLGRIEDVTVRNSLAMKAFDTEGVALVNVAKQGSRAMEEMRRQAHELGLVIDEDLLRNSEKVNDQFSIFARVMDTQVKKAVLETLPQIQSLMRTLIDNREQIAGVVTTFIDIGSSLFRAAAGAAEFVNKLGKGIGIAAGKFVNPQAEDQLNSLILQEKELIRQIEATPEASRNASNIYVQNLEKVRAEIIKVKKEAAAVNDFLAELKPAQEVTFEAPKFEPFIPASTKDIKKTQDDSKERMKAAREKERIQLQALNDEVRKRNELFSESQSVIDATRTPLENYNKELERLDFLLAKGAISEDVFNRAVMQAKDTLNSATEETEKLTDVTNDLGLTFSSAFENAIVEGGKLSDLLKGLEKDIIRILARKLVTEPLAAGITQSLSGGGFFGNLFTSVFGGARAFGGPVTAGNSYIVGDGGEPELFTPGVSGSITPISQVGGDVKVQINVEGVRDEGTLRQSAGQIAASAAMAVQRGQRNL